MNWESLMPSEKERKENEELARKVIEFIGSRFGLEARLVGSVAKGTYLRGNNEIDIFVLFPKRTSKEDLEVIGLGIGREVSKFLGGKAEVHYAEHPYTRVQLGNKTVEIVPAYKIADGDKILSAVDRTPLHTDYVIRKLKSPLEVVKLKWFMKKIGVYGAEISVRGFSGYLCELLVINYGSFNRVLEEASVWEPPVVIDIEGYYKDKEEILEKFNDPLVVIDPVDRGRNVAAPVHLDCLAKFCLASRMYIKTGKLPRRARISKREKLVIARWHIRKANEEVIWGQLSSFARRIKKELENNGFRVIDLAIWTNSKDTAEALFDLEIWELPRIEEHMGPSAFDVENSVRFIEKHSKVYIKNGRIWAERLRRWRTAEELVKKLLKESPKHLGKRYKLVPPDKSEIFKIYRKKMWKW